MLQRSSSSANDNNRDLKRKKKSRKREFKVFPHLTSLNNCSASQSCMKQSLRSNLFFVHSRSSLIRSHTAEVAERRHLFPSVATVTSLAAEDFISLHPRAARFSRRCLAQLRQTDDAYFESLQQNDRPLCTVMTSRTDVRTHDIDTGQMFTRVLCLFVRCVEILYSIVGNIYTTNCNSRYVFRGKNIPLNQCLE